MKYLLRSLVFRVFGSVLPALSLMLSASSVFAQERVVRLGIYENPPKLLLGQDGRPDGILGDLISRIAALEGWTLQTRRCEWNDCMAALSSGDIDLLPDVAATNARRQLFDFHNVPSLNSWSQLYARSTRISSLLDLAGGTVLALQGSVQYDYLRGMISSLGVDVRLEAVHGLEEGFSRVAAGRADAVAANHFYGETHASENRLVPTPVVFQPAELFYATRKGANPELLAAIDRHLEAWRDDPASPYFDILRKWQQSGPVATAMPAWLWWLVGGLAVLLGLALVLAALLQFQVARQTRHLRASEKRLNTILDSVDAQIYIKDRQLKYVYVNRKVCDFFGLSASAMIGLDNETLLGPEGNARLHEHDMRVLGRGERIAAEELLSSPLTGQLSTLFSVKIPLRNESGQVEALCGISTDITAHKAAQDTAHRLTYYDALTGLPNRLHILERLETAEAAVRDSGRLGAILMVGLDKFKRINEARGHATGDAILRGVAQRLKDATRPYDTVGRIGGDEFAILLERLPASPEVAAAAVMKIAGNLHQALSSPLVIDSQPYLLTGSIGATLIRPMHHSAEGLLREADTAMHRAKDAGANQTAFFEAAMQHDTEDRLTLENDLTNALGTGQISLHIQPQVDRQERVIGAELLMRWQHPERGAIPPARFIAMAEESDLILRLGDWALQQACLALHRLRAAGLRHPLSLNVSPRHFRQPDFVNRVRDIITETGAPASQLIFEVTEGVLIQDLHGTAERMAELSAIGIRFSIDDFGTGYSNLSYLKRLPLYELKIDKSFVHDIASSSDSAAIVTLILSMARQLQLHVVAEGVETAEQARFLVQHGCDAMQGYHFARPLPLDSWLASSAISDEYT